MVIYLKVIEQSDNHIADVKHMLSLFREVQNRIAYISGEMVVFIDAIEEKSAGISNKLLDKTEIDSLSDDEKGFLSGLEEDSEDIGKSVRVVRECIKKIEKAICSLMVSVDTDQYDPS